MFSIPKAGQIDVPDAPTITPLDFYKQIIENINSQLENVDKELQKAAKGDNSYVRALMESIHEIKSRAEQAEMIMIDIESDPEKLAVSLPKIQSSSDSFRQLITLVNSVKELEHEIKEGEYDYFRTVSELLLEVQEPLSEFESFSATPHVSLIKRKVAAIESELRRQIAWIFREIDPLAANFIPISSDATTLETDIEHQQEISASSPMDVTPILQVSLVVDVLGVAFRKDLLDRFSQLQLIPYEKMFKPSSANIYSGLDSLDQRFAWFRHLLGEVDSKMDGVFPSKWLVQVHLYSEFCRRSRIHLVELLTQQERESSNKSSRDPKIKVQFLLKLLTNVIAFEDYIKGLIVAKSEGMDPEEITTTSESIRESFDNFLGPYVQMERQGLEELMEEEIKREIALLSVPPAVAAAAAQTPASPGEPPVAALPPSNQAFESSRKMFEYMKGSLNRCTKYSTGLTFLSLSKEFRVCLQNYGEQMKSRCPPPLPSTKPDRLPEWAITASVEKNLCRILNTAKYCVDTIPPLEALMKNHIQEAYRDQIDFTQQVDVLMDTVAFTMNVLASGEVHRMQPDFEAMKKINWSALEDVGDVGSYAKHMLRILTDCVPRLRAAVASTYFQNLCQKLAVVFLDVYMENIWRLKKIGKTGGGQLLLDLNGIKEFIVTLPNVKLPDGTDPVPPISKVFLTVVTTKIKKIEAILKLVCTEDAMMEEMFSLLWPDGTKADLDRVINLKSSSRLIPINSATLDAVGDGVKNAGSLFKEGITTMKDGVTNVVDKPKTSVTGFVSKLGGGFKNAMGDMLSGNLFEHDDNGHTGSANNSAHGHGRSAAPAASGGGTSTARSMPPPPQQQQQRPMPPQQQQQSQSIGAAGGTAAATGKAAGSSGNGSGAIPRPAGVAAATADGGPSTANSGGGGSGGGGGGGMAALSAAMSGFKKPSNTSAPLPSTPAGNRTAPPSAKK